MKCRCNHGVPWFRDCPWCSYPMQDLAWIALWLNDAVFHANVCMVSQELVRQVRMRMTG